MNSSIENAVHSASVVALSDVKNDDSRLTRALMQSPTEDNVALAFAERHQGKYVYLHGRGSWLIWDGMRWATDSKSTIKEQIRALARDYNPTGKAYAAKSAFVSGVETFLKSDFVFSRNVNEFDSNNYLLNCPDGTYNLLTGDKQPHSQDDCITALAGASPSPNGGEVFKQFLDEITGSDKDLAAFHQITLGACLSGAVEEHWFLFWTGSGRNGKNTLGDRVLEAFGDYARSIPSSTLMSKTNGQHPTEIMNLKGMRLVASSEIEEGSHWAEAKIKELTGDEWLSGHYMRQDWVKFKRTHKFMIYGNYRPQLRSVDTGIKKRLLIVPFKQSFAGREDADLPQKLSKELGYILWWLMQGHKRWLEAGKKIGVCEAVERESKDYYESQSTIDVWLDECCKEEDSDQPGRCWPKASELYFSFREWKTERGEGPLSQQRFGEQLAQRYEKIKAAGVRYKGLKLKAIQEMY